MKPIDDPWLTAAGRQEISVIENILLHVRIGDLQVRVFFGVVKSLALSVILWKSFIYRSIKGIFPGERKILRHQSKRVSILASFADNLISTVLEETANKVHSTPLFRVTKQVLLPPMSENSFLVHTKSAGFM